MEFKSELILMLILMLLMEGIVLCFILLMFCVIGIANGPEKFTVFYEKNVQEKAIKLGYTTQKEIKKQTIISIIVLYLPCFILVLMLSWDVMIPLCHADMKLPGYLSWNVPFDGAVIRPITEGISSYIHALPAL